jgi:hypothetical protein
MAAALYALMALCVLTVILALLPWSQNARTWILAAIPIASIGLVAFLRVYGGMSSVWPLPVWLVTLGPGSTIAIVRLLLIARGGERQPDR